MEPKRHIEFTVKLTPFSCNSLYTINMRQRTVSLKEECRKFKDDLKILMPRFIVQSTSLLAVYIKYKMNWYTKEGKIKKKDGANLDKLTHDAISEKLKVDDSHFFKWGGEKVQSEDECLITIRIEEL